MGAWLAARLIEIVKIARIREEATRTNHGNTKVACHAVRHQPDAFPHMGDGNAGPGVV